MSESVLPEDSESGKRRSTRIEQAVPITVTGVDALGQPFKERTTTTKISAHGCKYQSKHYVPKNSIITIEVPHPEAGENASRFVKARVIWVQRPRTVRELFQLGVDFDAAGNVWGISFPPEDWKLSYGQSPSPSERLIRGRAVAGKTELTPSSTPVAEHRTGGKLITAKEGSANESPDARSERPTVPSEIPKSSTVTEKGIHVIPDLEQTSETQVAVASMIADARLSIEKTLRKEAQTAISEEMSVVRIQLDAQLHETVERAIRSSLERVSESAVKKVVQTAAKQAAMIVEQAKKDIDVRATQIDQQLRQSIKEAAGMAAKHNLEEAQREAKERLAILLSQAKQVTEGEIAGVEDRIRQATQEAAASAEQIARSEAQEAAARIEAMLAEVQKMAAEKQVDDQLLAGSITEEALRAAAKRALEEQLSSRAEEAVERALKAKAESLHSEFFPAENISRAVDWRNHIEENAHSLPNEAIERARTEIEAFGEAWRQQFEAKLAGGLDVINETIEQGARRLAERSDTQVVTAKSELERTLADLMVRELTPKIEQAERLAADFRDAAQQMTDRTREEMQRTADEAMQKTAALNEDLAQTQKRIREEIDRAAAETQRGVSETFQQKDLAIAEASLQIQRAVEGVSQTIAQIESVRQEAAQVESQLSEQVQRASEQATKIMEDLSQQMQGASEQTLADMHSRLQIETVRVPEQFEATCRAILTNIEKELDEKSSDAQHETFEALSKAADWHQKKAQTTMNAALERVLEQSAAALERRAGEISSMVTAELDHHRRTYLEHTQAELQDNAKEMVHEQRLRLKESAEMASATFTDRVNRTIHEAAQHFEHAAHATVERLRSDMEVERERSFSDFERRIAELLAHTSQEGQQHLHAQLSPILESWKLAREDEHHEVVARLNRAAEESLETYKARLENAANSWLAASATMLVQNSQETIDTLAKAAEARLRETCALVLAGMGDLLKERLLGISSGIDRRSERSSREKP